MEKSGRSKQRRISSSFEESRKTRQERNVLGNKRRFDERRGNGWRWFGGTIESNERTALTPSISKGIQMNSIKLGRQIRWNVNWNLVCETIFDLFKQNTCIFLFSREEQTSIDAKTKRRERGKEIRVPFEFSFLLISERETKLARLYRSWFERVKNNSATRAINGWKEFSR